MAKIVRVTRRFGLGPCRGRAAAVIAILAAAVPTGLPAASDASSLCEDAAALASSETGVPLAVLSAVSLTETGRKRGGAFRPWPWTVNMEGRGAWFDTQGEALGYVNGEFRRGARSFDVGCFQINYKWHGANFASISQMFEPTANARYAARLLRSLRAELGSWSAAAGAYHSRTPQFANRYRDRFDRIYAGISGAAPGTFPTATGRTAGFATETGDPSGIPEIPDIVLAMNGTLDGADSGVRPWAAAPRVNRYPLLQAGVPSVSGMGSLVPLSGPTAQVILEIDP